MYFKTGYNSYNPFEIKTQFDIIISERVAMTLFEIITHFELNFLSLEKFYVQLFLNVQN